MKLDFNTYPLSVYSQSTSKNILKLIGGCIPQSRLSRSSTGLAILSSFVSRAAGAGLLSLIDNVSIGLKGEKARKCLANLIREQTNRVNRNPSKLLEDAQLNLMASSCVTGYLSSLESASFGNGVKNMGKLLLGLFSLQNPLEVIAESVIEVSNKYDDICQVYHIAFLLTVYNSNTRLEDMIKRLITESLCNDDGGESDFSIKKRPVLFSGVQYKTLEENEKNRMGFLTEGTRGVGDLYDSFVKWRIDINAQ